MLEGRKELSVFQTCNGLSSLYADYWFACHFKLLFMCLSCFNPMIVLLSVAMRLNSRVAQSVNDSRRVIACYWRNYGY